MSCPYLDCDEPSVPEKAAACPKCRRLTKGCPSCKTANRAFSNFCRRCGHALPDSAADWTGSKGGPQRLGLNPTRQAAPFRELKIQQVRESHLGDHCRSLLSCDGHLVAVSAGGTVEISDVSGRAAPLRINVDGPVTCDPCISRGTLFIGAAGRVTAYPLGTLTRQPPRLDPRWSIRLEGTPVNPLTVAEGRLYVTVALQNRRREVRVIDHIDRDQPLARQAIYAAARLSWMAADAPTRRLVFLSEEGKDLFLHSTATGGTRFHLTSRRIANAPSPFAEHIPIALAGTKVYGVFGDAEKLCRLDAAQGTFEQVIRDDAKAFALSSIRDGVLVDSGGLYFLGMGMAERLNNHERIKGHPVLLADCAVAVGLQDGRLRVYDLHNPSFQETLRLSGEGEEVTALASFGTCLAAGTARGLVKLFELVRKSPS